MFYDLKDKKPKNSGENWVAPNAVVIGDVTLVLSFFILIYKLRYK